MSQPSPNLPDQFTFPGDTSQQQQYPALNNRIMMAAVVILFVVIFFVLGLHIYAKWFWRRSFLAATHGGLGRAASRNGPGQRGLDKDSIDGIPTFVFHKSLPADPSATEPGQDRALECSVCLCEFQENEKGREIPPCNHKFHIGCIDMWLFSHSTCPLCRIEVTPKSPTLPSSSPSPATTSTASSTSPHHNSATSPDLDSTPARTHPNPNPGSYSFMTTSHGHISVDIPNRPADLEMYTSCSSDPNPLDPSVKSPGLRNSFKRIMGRQSSRISAAELPGADP